MGNALSHEVVELQQMLMNATWTDHRKRRQICQTILNLIPHGTLCQWRDSRIFLGFLNLCKVVLSEYQLHYQKSSSVSPIPYGTPKNEKHQSNDNTSFYSDTAFSDSSSYEDDSSVSNFLDASDSNFNNSEKLERSDLACLIQAFQKLLTSRCYYHNIAQQPSFIIMFQEILYLNVPESDKIHLIVLLQNLTKNIWNDASLNKDISKVKNIIFKPSIIDVMITTICEAEKFMWEEWFLVKTDHWTLGKLTYDFNQCLIPTHNVMSSHQSKYSLSIQKALLILEWSKQILLEFDGCDDWPIQALLFDKLSENFKILVDLTQHFDVELSTQACFLLLAMIYFFPSAINKLQEITKMSGVILGILLMASNSTKNLADGCKINHGRRQQISLFRQLFACCCQNYPPCIKLFQKCFPKFFFELIGLTYNYSENTETNVKTLTNFDLQRVAGQWSLFFEALETEFEDIDIIWNCKILHELRLNLQMELKIVVGQRSLLNTKEVSWSVDAFSVHLSLLDKEFCVSGVYLVRLIPLLKKYAQSQGLLANDFKSVSNISKQSSMISVFSSTAKFDLNDWVTIAPALSRPPLLPYEKKSNVQKKETNCNDLFFDPTKLWNTIFEILVVQHHRFINPLYVQSWALLYAVYFDHLKNEISIPFILHLLESKNSLSSLRVQLLYLLVLSFKLKKHVTEFINHNGMRLCFDSMDVFCKQACWNEPSNSSELASNTQEDVETCNSIYKLQSNSNLFDYPQNEFERNLINQAITETKYRSDRIDDACASCKAILSYQSSHFFSKIETPDLVFPKEIVQTVFNRNLYTHLPELPKSQDLLNDWSSTHLRYQQINATEKINFYNADIESKCFKENHAYNNFADNNRIDQNTPLQVSNHIPSSPYENEAFPLRKSSLSGSAKSWEDESDLNQQQNCFVAREEMYLWIHVALSCADSSEEFLKNILYGRCLSQILQILLLPPKYDDLICGIAELCISILNAQSLACLNMIENRAHINCLFSILRPRLPIKFKCGKCNFLLQLGGPPPLPVIQFLKQLLVNLNLITPDRISEHTYCLQYRHASSGQLQNLISSLETHKNLVDGLGTELLRDWLPSPIIDMLLQTYGVSRFQRLIVSKSYSCSLIWNCEIRQKIFAAVTEALQPLHAQDLQQEVASNDDFSHCVNNNFDITRSNFIVQGCYVDELGRCCAMLWEHIILPIIVGHKPATLNDLTGVTILKKSMLSSLIAWITLLQKKSVTESLIKWVSATESRQKFIENALHLVRYDHSLNNLTAASTQIFDVFDGIWKILKNIKNDSNASSEFSALTLQCLKGLNGLTLLLPKEIAVNPDSISVLQWVCSQIRSHNHESTVNSLKLGHAIILSKFAFPLKLSQISTSQQTLHETTESLGLEEFLSAISSHLCLLSSRPYLTVPAPYDTKSEDLLDTTRVETQRASELSPQPSLDLSVDMGMEIQNSSHSESASNLNLDFNSIPLLHSPPCDICGFFHDFSYQKSPLHYDKNTWDAIWEECVIKTARFNDYNSCLQSCLFGKFVQDVGTCIGDFQPDDDLFLPNPLFLPQFVPHECLQIVPCACLSTVLSLINIMVNNDEKVITTVCKDVHREDNNNNASQKFSSQNHTIFKLSHSSNFLKAAEFVLPVLIKLLMHDQAHCWRCLCLTMRILQICFAKFETRITALDAGIPLKLISLLYHAVPFEETDLIAKSESIRVNILSKENPDMANPGPLLISFHVALLASETLACMSGIQPAYWKSSIICFDKPLSLIDQIFNQLLTPALMSLLRNSTHLETPVTSNVSCLYRFLATFFSNNIRPCVYWNHCTRQLLLNFIKSNLHDIGQKQKIEKFESVSIGYPNKANSMVKPLWEYKHSIALDYCIQLYSDIRNDVFCCGIYLGILNRSKFCCLEHISPYSFLSAILDTLSYTCNNSKTIGLRPERLSQIILLCTTALRCFIRHSVHLQYKLFLVDQSKLNVIIDLLPFTFPVSYNWIESLVNFIGDIINVKFPLITSWDKWIESTLIPKLCHWIVFQGTEFTINLNTTNHNSNVNSMNGINSDVHNLLISIDLLFQCLHFQYQRIEQAMQSGIPLILLWILLSLRPHYKAFIARDYSKKDQQVQSHFIELANDYKEEISNNMIFSIFEKLLFSTLKTLSCFVSQHGASLESEFMILSLFGPFNFFVTRQKLELGLDNPLKFFTWFYCLDDEFHHDMYNLLKEEWNQIAPGCYRPKIEPWINCEDLKVYEVYWDWKGLLSRLEKYYPSQKNHIQFRDIQTDVSIFLNNVIQEKEPIIFNVLCKLSNQLRSCTMLTEAFILDKNMSEANAACGSRISKYLDVPELHTVSFESMKKNKSLSSQCKFYRVGVDILCHWTFFFAILEKMGGNQTFEHLFDDWLKSLATPKDFPNRPGSYITKMNCQHKVACLTEKNMFVDVNMPTFNLPLTETSIWFDYFYHLRACTEFGISTLDKLISSLECFCSADAFKEATFEQSELHWPSLYYEKLRSRHLLFLELLNFVKTHLVVTCKILIKAMQETKQMGTLLRLMDIVRLFRIHIPGFLCAMNQLFFFYDMLACLDSSRAFLPQGVETDAVEAFSSFQLKCTEWILISAKEFVSCSLSLRRILKPKIYRQFHLLQCKNYQVVKSSLNRCAFDNLMELQSIQNLFNDSTESIWVKHDILEKELQVEIITKLKGPMPFRCLRNM